MFKCKWCQRNIYSLLLWNYTYIRNVITLCQTLREEYLRLVFLSLLLLRITRILWYCSDKNTPNAECCDFVRARHSAIYYTDVQHVPHMFHHQAIFLFPTIRYVIFVGCLIYHNLRHKRRSHFACRWKTMVFTHDKQLNLQSKKVHELKK